MAIHQSIPSTREVTATEEAVKIVLDAFRSTLPEAFGCQVNTANGRSLPRSRTNWVVLLKLWHT